MGEEYGETSPFPFFCNFESPELVEAVRKGRKAEFAHFNWQEEPPDPVASSTRDAAVLSWSWDKNPSRLGLRRLYHDLLRLRRECPTLRDFRPAGHGGSKKPRARRPRSDPGRHRTRPDARASDLLQPGRRAPHAADRPGVGTSCVPVGNRHLRRNGFRGGREFDATRAARVPDLRGSHREGRRPLTVPQQDPGSLKPALHESDSIHQAGRWWSSLREAHPPRTRPNRPPGVGGSILRPCCGISTTACAFSTVGPLNLKPEDKTRFGGSGLLASSLHVISSTGIIEAAIRRVTSSDPPARVSPAHTHRTFRLVEARRLCFPRPRQRLLEASRSPTRSGMLSLDLSGGLRGNRGSIGASLRSRRWAGRVQDPAFPAPVREAGISSGAVTRRLRSVPWRRHDQENLQDRGESTTRKPM